jgi:hypothetical protein
MLGLDWSKLFGGAQREPEWRGSGIGTGSLAGKTRHLKWILDGSETYCNDRWRTGSEMRECDVPAWILDNSSRGKIQGSGWTRGDGSLVRSECLPVDKKSGTDFKSATGFELSKSAIINAAFSSGRRVVSRLLPRQGLCDTEN